MQLGEEPGKFCALGQREGGFSVNSDRETRRMGRGRGKGKGRDWGERKGEREGIGGKGEEER